MSTQTRHPTSASICSIQALVISQVRSSRLLTLGAVGDQNFLGAMRSIAAGCWFGGGAERLHHLLGLHIFVPKWPEAPAEPPAESPGDSGGGSAKMDPRPAHGASDGMRCGGACNILGFPGVWASMPACWMPQGIHVGRKFCVQCGLWPAGRGLWCAFGVQALPPRRALALALSSSAPGAS